MLKFWVFPYQHHEVQPNVKYQKNIIIILFLGLFLQTFRTEVLARQTERHPLSFYPEPSLFVKTDIIGENKLYVTNPALDFKRDK